MQYFSELFSMHLIDVSTIVVALCKKWVALDANYSIICTLLKFRHLYQKASIFMRILEHFKEVQLILILHGNKRTTANLHGRTVTQPEIESAVS